MFLHAWFRPPRHLLGLFLLVTLVPSALLIAFGWRSLQQDRAAALARSQDPPFRLTPTLVRLLD